MTFGQWLRAERQRRGLTLHTAAGMLNCSPSYLSDVERGRRDPGAALQMALVVRWDLPVAVVALRAGEAPDAWLISISDDDTVQRAWAACRAILSEKGELP